MGKLKITNMNITEGEKKKLELDMEEEIYEVKEKLSIDLNQLPPGKVPNRANRRKIEKFKSRRK